MTDPIVTPALVQKHGLTPEEYDGVKKILGREPSYTELGIFSVMWSEHCSYKNTRPLLKGFPTKSPKILVGAGEENAGIIDIGDGLAIAFKIESHNHPSAVEPFQGAATGVGGIIRDIFTMGARPICAINSLRFGPIQMPAGRPTSPQPSPPSEGGEGEGAQAISEISNLKSQIANNQRLFSGVVAGIQDMGAAGLTCSTCETAARAGTGIEIDLSKVPQRAPGMTPYEIMLSESQERMLIIVKKGREAEVQRIFDKWDLPWAEIGFVTDTGQMVVKHHGKIGADIPAAKLANDAPIYQREAREPVYLKEVRAFTLAGLPDTSHPVG